MPVAARPRRDKQPLGAGGRRSQQRENACPASGVDCRGTASRSTSQEIGEVIRHACAALAGADQRRGRRALRALRQQRARDPERVQEMRRHGTGRRRRRATPATPPRRRPRARSPRQHAATDPDNEAALSKGRRHRRRRRGGRHRRDDRRSARRGAAAVRGEPAARVHGRRGGRGGPVARLNLLEGAIRRDMVCSLLRLEGEAVPRRLPALLNAPHPRHFSSVSHLYIGITRDRPRVLRVVDRALVESRQYLPALGLALASARRASLIAICAIVPSTRRPSHRRYSGRRSTPRCPSESAAAGVYGLLEPRRP